MGNQLFQYAFGLKLAKQLNAELHLDLSSLLDRSKGDFVYRNYDLSIFNIEQPFVHSPSFLEKIYKLKSRWITKQIRKSVLRKGTFHKEVDFHFQETILNEAKDNSIYEGWYQSPKYFAGVETELRKNLQFKAPVLKVSEPLLQKMKNSNSICLNVRRTDFLQVDTLNTTNKDYFLQAAEQLARAIPDPEFFIFSDDMNWCQEHLQLPYPTHFVSHEHKGHKFGNYLHLMSQCKHYIIPNSSFAWWAIWLNGQSTKKVIAPKNWFNDPKIDTSDLVPVEWMRL